MRDQVRITREASDPDDWLVDEVTGDLTRPDAELVYEGPATIAGNEQRYSETNVDRLYVRVPWDVHDVRRSDMLEVLQSRDQNMRASGIWMVLDVDVGTHHITRRLECLSRIPTVQVPPREFLEDR
jgi:hypothetical protein